MIAIYPKLIQLGRSGQIESLACAVREYYGEDQAYAKSLNVWRLCQSIGIGLRERDELAGGLARIVARDERGQFEICIERSAKMSGTLTDQLLIAHLLGHGFLDLVPKIAEGEIRSPAVFTEGVVPILSSYEAEGLWKTERSLSLEHNADHFALALLMPKRFILAALEKFRATDKVARFFQLPEAVITARIHSLGLSQTMDGGRDHEMSPARHDSQSQRFGAKEMSAGVIEAQPMTQPASPVVATEQVAKRYAEAALPPGQSQPRTPHQQGASAELRATHDRQDGRELTRTPRTARPAAKPQRYTAAKGHGTKAPLQGISQLRELAKKIDGSVDL